MTKLGTLYLVPNTLGEVVSDLSVRSGFPSVVLSPINFEALYAQQKQQQAQDEAAKTTH